jgi:hypothetical protein
MPQDNQRSDDARKKALKMTIAGGLSFWVSIFATSLTPLAAEYRAALSISYLPMLVEALLGGMIVSFCLSYCLLNFNDKLPARDAIEKSLILSLVALSIASIRMYVAASRTSDVFYVMVTGIVINVPRFLTVGFVLGYLIKRGSGVKAGV